MKKIRTRLLSLLLVLVTVLSLLPTSALAASSTGTGIKPTNNTNYWTTRLLHDGTPYSYKPPMAAGKMLYCMDRGYGYRWGTASFLNSYTYTSATGADADAVLKTALAQSGMGELDAQQLENFKWMMTYIVDYKGDIPGSLFMAAQTYVWDHQTFKGEGDGDIDGGGYANADTYETYLGYEEAARDERADTSKLREQLQLLREKIARREVEKYQSKFTEALAEASARVKDLGVRYQRENAAYKAFHAGMECPACHRSVTEQSLPEVQAALKKVLSELYAAGSEQRAQLIELQEMDKKAADTFAQFKEDDLGKWAAEAAEMEQRCASLAEQASAETERLRAEIQTLTADLEYGNLSQSEYDHLGTCREELRQSEAKIAALQTMTAAQLPDFDREIAQANASIAEIKRKMANVIAYISKRAELTFSQLKMNRVEISLYDVVKSTGEVKDTFKFQYGGRRYDRLSLSEKIRAGMEVSELMKRLTGRNYPVFVDNMESVDDLANVRPTGQIIMAKCVSGAALQVKPIRPIAFAEQRAA